MKSSVQKFNSDKGFSIIELVVVLLIIGVLSAFAVWALKTSKLYNAETQALALIDVMQEARQRSLSQRRTMRVEINSTKKLIRLINENTPGNASDDTIIKSVPFMDNNTLLIGRTPTNMSGSPTELSPVPASSFSTSLHPLSANDKVITLRFLRNGTVVNAGNDAIGTGAVPTGATIYVWARRDTDTNPNTTAANIFRAVTVLGSSGATRLWKCATVNNQCTNWTP